MNNLPKGWANASLGELTEKLVDGSHNPPSKAASGLPMLSARNIMDGKINFDQYRFIDPEIFEIEHRRTRITAGDVLLTIVGTIGRSAVVPNGLQQFTLQRSVAVMTPTAAVASSYLSYFFQSADIQHWFEDNAKGTAQKGVYLGALSKLAVPVAPFPEQRRIVAKVDGLTARTARARKELDRIPTLIARYKQRLLALAFSGELTGGAEGWQTATIGELADTQLGKMLDKAKNTGEPTRYLRNINVRWFDFQLEDVLEMPMSDEERRKFSIKDGDILTCEGGEPGRSAIWNKGPTDLAFQKALIRIRPDLERLNPSYLVYHLKYLADAQELERHFTGSTIKHLPQRALQNIGLPLPPIEEQAEIVRRIESAFGWLDRMVADQAAAARLLPKLDAAILAKAFRGDLVPQDPNDEPASALLERIKVERTEAPKAKRGKQVHSARPSKDLQIMAKNLEQVLAEAGGWISAQDAFQKCGIGGAATTAEIEEIYAELRKLDKAGRIEAEPVNDDQGRKLHDLLRLKAA